MKYFFIILVKTYRMVVSPMWHGIMGPLACCRFTPTCGAYAEEALRKHGSLKGGWLALKRVCRCHPWCKGGADSVP